MRFLHNFRGLRFAALAGVVMAFTQIACLSAAVPTLTPAPTGSTGNSGATSVPTLSSGIVFGSASTQPDHCVERSDWYAYRVQQGDTLGVLAQRSGTTLAGLISGNCLDNANQINTGQIIYVPRIPVTQVPP